MHIWGTDGWYGTWRVRVCPLNISPLARQPARAIAHPGDRGPANDLIAEIAAAAETKEARHDMKEHRGKSMEEALQHSLTGLEPAAAAVRKLPPDEAAQVGGWLVDIANAVAGAAKTVNPGEHAAIGKIAALFAPPG